MNHDFKDKHAEGIATAMLDTHEYVLVARVMMNDQVCIVRAEEVGKALLAIHGKPKLGLCVSARIEYVESSADDFAGMVKFDRAGKDH